MNNWDSREEEGKNCTISEDIKSIERTCKILDINKLHHVNYQSSYWQRVFSPVLSGYQNGYTTPNPDILCNKEIKFGELYEWAIEGAGGADYLATGHYARIDRNLVLRQAKDIGKDQTYFLAAINRNCLNRIIFPVGNLLKSTVKTDILRESGLNHLIDRKESMGLCFIGKRGKFRDFMDNFVPQSEPGPIIEYETGNEIGRHKGLSNYTIGQNVALSGAKGRLYLSKKDHEHNSLIVVDDQSHPALWTRSFKISSIPIDLKEFTQITCSIRSVDKIGTKLKSFKRLVDCVEIELEDFVYAPCPGQWAVFYAQDGLSEKYGRICLGGGEII